MPFPFICPNCGKQTVVADAYLGQSGPCGNCGQIVTVLPPGAARPRDLGDDAGMRLLLPVGRSLWAIAAGYAGLISILVFPAPFAVLLGILAIRDIKRHPEKHGMGRAIFGLVMGGLFSIGLILALTAMAVGGTHGH
jgi:hypothetical protein